MEENASSFSGPTYGQEYMIYGSEMAHVRLRNCSTIPSLNIKRH